MCTKITKSAGRRKAWRVGNVVAVRLGRGHIEGLPTITCFTCDGEARPWFDALDGSAPAYGNAEVEGSEHDGLHTSVPRPCFDAPEEESTCSFCTSTQGFHRRQT